jgi:hypothetical protein
MTHTRFATVALTAAMLIAATQAQAGNGGAVKALPKGDDANQCRRASGRREGDACRVSGQRLF